MYFTEDEIILKVKAIIADKLVVGDAEIQSSADFKTDLGADSIDLVELIMELERAFNITISDEEAEKIKTVGDAMAYVVQCQKGTEG